MQIGLYSIVYDIYVVLLDTYPIAFFLLDTHLLTSSYMRCKTLLKFALGYLAVSLSHYLCVYDIQLATEVPLRITRTSYLALFAPIFVRCFFEIVSKSRGWKSYFRTSRQCVVQLVFAATVSYNGSTISQPLKINYQVYTIRNSRHWHKNPGLPLKNSVVVSVILACSITCTAESVGDNESGFSSTTIYTLARTLDRRKKAKQW